MDEADPASITFTLNARSHTLSRATVEARLVDVEPERIAKYSVQVGDTSYPVLQVLSLAIARSRKEFNSHTAARHLHDLGFSVQPAWPPPNTPREADVETRTASATALSPADEEWHTEAEVQATIARWLEESGWEIVSSVDTAKKAPGIDVVARRGVEMVGVEVKGYPSAKYADPAKAHLPKKTHPATQARQWFAGALLAAARLHHKKVYGLDGKDETWANVIALPDFQTYRALTGSTRASLAALGVEVWWVRRDGSVTKA